MKFYVLSDLSEVHLFTYLVTDLVSSEKTLVS